MGKRDNKSTLRRLVWLLDTIYKSGDEGITKQEIFEKWKRKEDLSYGKDYPERTFRNNLQDIADIFDVDVECVGRKYRIAYRDGIDTDALTNWMLNSISVKNTIIGNLKLRERILFEPIPAGGRLLQPILDAMEAFVIVKIDYRRFDAEKAIEYTVEPYFLKLFRRRWYLVGFCSEMDKIYTFSLDRIKNISLTKDYFEMPKPEIDESDFFGNCFGIMWKEKSTPEMVVIKVYGEQIDYIKSAPLHESQRETSRGYDANGDFSVFEFYLHITYDFVQELLSHGKSLQVMEPVSLKKEMRTHVSAMLKYYPKKLVSMP